MVVSQTDNMLGQVPSSKSTLRPEEINEVACTPSDMTFLNEASDNSAVVKREET